MEKIALPFLQGDGREVGVPRNSFFALGLVEVCVGAGWSVQLTFCWLHVCAWRNRHPRLTPRPHHHYHLVAVAGDIMSDVGRAGASKRRRDRQLRAFHRHEQLTVRMELATAIHHSAQRPKTVVEVPREGCGARAARSATATPQTSDRTVRLSSRASPSLALLVLAAMACEVVDS